MDNLIKNYERCLYYACMYSEKYGCHIPKIEDTLNRIRSGEDIGSAEKIWPSYFIRNVLNYQDELKYLDYWDNQVNVDEYGVVRWISNNRVPNKEILKVWDRYSKPFNYYASLDAYDHEIEEEIENYRNHNKDYKPTDEDLMEMRSVFGEGNTVVDIITGKKVVL